jgi:hypothetical protein
MDVDKTRPDQIMDNASYSTAIETCIKCHKERCSGCKETCMHEGGDVIVSKTH